MRILVANAMHTWTARTNRLTPISQVLVFHVAAAPPHVQTVTISECRYRWLRLPATKFGQKTRQSQGLLGFFLPMVTSGRAGGCAQRRDIRTRHYISAYLRELYAPCCASVARPLCPPFTPIEAPPGDSSRSGVEQRDIRAAPGHELSAGGEDARARASLSTTAAADSARLNYATLTLAKA